MGSWHVVVAAAGQGTRFRPFTRTLPKEILPIGGTPAVELVVREALSAGATAVTVVVRPGDKIVANHLRSAGLSGEVRIVDEDLQHGYGNAAPLLTCEPNLRELSEFGVAFGDDVLLGGDDLSQMRRKLTADVDVVIAGTHVPRQDAVNFGVLVTAPDDLDCVVSLKQRPRADEFVEPLVVVSRLILRPSIFAYLHRDWGGGEADLGLAVAALAADRRVVVHRLTGTWITVGDPEHYVQAQLAWQELRAGASTSAAPREERMLAGAHHAR